MVTLGFVLTSNARDIPRAISVMKKIWEARSKIVSQGVLNHENEKRTEAMMIKSMRRVFISSEVHLVTTLVVHFNLQEEYCLRPCRDLEWRQNEE
jgi:hypothetical protein